MSSDHEGNSVDPPEMQMSISAGPRQKHHLETSPSAGHQLKPGGAQRSGTINEEGSVSETFVYEKRTSTRTKARFTAYSEDDVTTKINSVLGSQNGGLFSSSKFDSLLQGNQEKGSANDRKTGENTFSFKELTKATDVHVAMTSSRNWQTKREGETSPDKDVFPFNPDKTDGLPTGRSEISSTPSQAEQSASDMVLLEDFLRKYGVNSRRTHPVPAGSSISELVNKPYSYKPYNRHPCRSSTELLPTRDMKPVLKYGDPNSIPYSWRMLDVSQNNESKDKIGLSTADPTRNRSVLHPGQDFTSNNETETLGPPTSVPGSSVDVGASSTNQPDAQSRHQAVGYQNTYSKLYAGGLTTNSKSSNLQVGAVEGSYSKYSSSLSKYPSMSPGNTEFLKSSNTTLDSLGPKSGYGRSKRDNVGFSLLQERQRLRQIDTLISGGSGMNSKLYASTPYMPHSTRPSAGSTFESPASGSQIWESPSPAYGSQHDIDKIRSSGSNVDTGQFNNNKAKYGSNQYLDRSNSHLKGDYDHYYDESQDQDYCRPVRTKQNIIQKNKLAVKNTPPIRERAEKRPSQRGVTPGTCKSTIHASRVKPALIKSTKKANVKGAKGRDVNNDHNSNQPDEHLYTSQSHSAVTDNEDWIKVLGQLRKKYFQDKFFLDEDLKIPLAERNGFNRYATRNEMCNLGKRSISENNKSDNKSQPKSALKKSAKQRTRATGPVKHPASSCMYQPNCQQMNPVYQQNEEFDEKVVQQVASGLLKNKVSRSKAKVADNAQRHLIAATALASGLIRKAQYKMMGNPKPALPTREHCNGGVKANGYSNGRTKANERTNGCAKANDHSNGCSKANTHCNGRVPGNTGRACGSKCPQAVAKQPGACKASRGKPATPGQFTCRCNPAWEN